MSSPAAACSCCLATLLINLALICSALPAVASGGLGHGGACATAWSGRGACGRCFCAVLQPGAAAVSVLCFLHVCCGMLVVHACVCVCVPCTHACCAAAACCCSPVVHVYACLSVCVSVYMHTHACAYFPGGPWLDMATARPQGPPPSPPPLPLPPPPHCLFAFSPPPLLLNDLDPSPAN